METIAVISVLAVLVCGIDGQRVSTQNLTVYCLKLTSTNQLQMDFRLDVKSDPVGFVRALDTSGNVITSECTISYNNATNVYSVVSLINLGNNQPVTNRCGFSVDATNTLFSWRLKYHENPNGFANADSGLNRIHTATCNLSSIPSDTTTSGISPVAPNINVNVTVAVPPVAFVVLYETTVNSGVYQPITSSTPSLSTGVRLRLQLQVAFGTYSAAEIYGVGGLRVRVAGDINFNNAITFFNTTGCPSDTNYAPNTAYGFLGPTTTTPASPFLATTEEFIAWKFDNSDFLYFEVNYQTCRADVYNSDLFCRDPCNNPRASTGRRRRDVDDTEERTAIVAIRIYDPSENVAKPQSESGSTMVYVGMSMALLTFLALLAVIACLLVVRAKRRADAEESKKTPPQSFVNEVAYSY